MADEDINNFDEPQIYRISKYKLAYSILVLIAIVLSTVIEKIPTPPPICLASFVFLAIYLLLPHTYKLVVSNEAISSINYLRTGTLEWNELAEIENKNGNLLLRNQDGSIKVTVNQQIDGYPEVIKFIKEQRPDLWNLDDTQTFHQGYLEEIFQILFGIVIFIAGIWLLMQEGFSMQNAVIFFMFMLLAGWLFFSGVIKVRKIFMDGDVLVIKQLIGDRQFHVSEVLSVSMEQKFGKNVVTYPVRIRIRNKKDIVIEKAKEGNSILVNALEMWMNKYNGKQNDKF
jgi:hypothetical protein